MQRLWIHLDGQWLIVPLEKSQFELSANSARPVSPGVCDAPAVVVPCGGDKSQWALIARPGAQVDVNGDRLWLGVRILSDRDCIQVDGGERMYYSASANPTVVTFAGKSAIQCPRCDTAITTGQLVVRCPGCGVHYHQARDLACWLYDVRCRCGHPTDLSEDNCWTPEEC